MDAAKTQEIERFLNKDLYSGDDMDRAKRMIRDLREENEKLKRDLALSRNQGVKP